jgi:curved DNA-binding protein CbpA
VRQAYIAHALRHHPDRQEHLDVAGRAEAERRMQAVNGAWEVLGDREARAAYDAQLGIVRTVDPGPDLDEPVIGLQAPSGARRFVPLAVFLGLAILFLVVTAYAGAPRS